MGLFFWDPKTPNRTFSFFDGQNLYHQVKAAFGYKFPNYDPMLLASEICKPMGWGLQKVYFYTGIPSAQDNAQWNSFWVAKLAQMGKQGVQPISRPLRYRNQRTRLPDGTETSVLVGEEKGIDVRIAIDVISKAIRNEYDIALIFSQDQDLAEVAQEIREIARLQSRYIKIACAFPTSPTVSNKRGINNTDWHPFDRSTYERCIDRRDYRNRA